MSDATKMGDELLQLAQGIIPQTREWKTEIHLDRGALPDSRNKFLACNAAEAIFAQRRGDAARVRELLDWWVWFATTPFTAGEDLTPEEVYRGLMAYGALAAAAVAKITHHADAYRATLELAKAHAAWLLLGAGCGPARKVRNHHLDKIGKPVVLVGDGAAVSHLPYIAQAGKRGWIRNRDGPDKTFHFSESVGLSAIVGQAAGLNVPRKGVGKQVDMLAALTAYAPGLPPFGFSTADQTAARAFLSNPTDPTLARHVVTWVEHQAPELTFLFVRYADGGIVTLCEHAGTSSTDSRMIDAWYSDGRSMKTSADDGLRSSSPAQRGFELGDAFACQQQAGGVVMTLPRPHAAEAWRLRTANGKVTFAVPGVTGGIAPAPTSPAPDPIPQPKPRKKRRWWEFWK